MWWICGFTANKWNSTACLPFIRYMLINSYCQTEASMAYHRLTKLTLFQGFLQLSKLKIDGLGMHCKNKQNVWSPNTSYYPSTRSTVDSSNAVFWHFMHFLTVMFAAMPWLGIFCSGYLPWEISSIDHRLVLWAGKIKSQQLMCIHVWTPAGLQCTGHQPTPGCRYTYYSICISTFLCVLCLTKFHEAKAESPTKHL